MATFSRSIAFAMFAVLSLSSAIPAFADPALSQTAMQSAGVAALHTGDLVRVRSGGPLMTITKIQGDAVNCSWTDWNGELKSETFPVADLQGPITSPPLDPNLVQEQNADDQYRKDCPTGTLSALGEFKCPR